VADARTPVVPGADPLLVIDGGDRGCGDLLLDISRQIRALPPGSRVRIISRDTAADDDLPRWCRLTSHDYLGRSSYDAENPSFDIRTANKTGGPS